MDDIKQHKIQQEQKMYAMNIVKNVRIAKRGRADGSFKQRYAGVLGEVIFCDLMELPRKTKEDYEEFDGGVDFVIGDKKIDLKVLLSRVPFRHYYSNNLMASQLEYILNETEVYLFAVINTEKSTIQFNGWIKKNDITRRWRYPKGTPRPRGRMEPLILPADTYEIFNNQLKEFNPMVFASDMKMFDLTVHSARRYN